jgi:hypothetical protein
MNYRSLVLWKSPQSSPVVARIAVAGDFLPTGSLSVPAGGWSEAASAVAPIFENIDASFVNLECPLDVGGLPFRPLTGIGEIVFATSGTLDYLRVIRTVAVGIANNHAGDFGSVGVERTRTAIVTGNLVPLGAGRTLGDSPEIFIWQGPADIRIGFWAAARASRDLATRRTAGVEPATISRARRAIATLKSPGAQFSVALLHSGCIRTNRPDPSDVALIDAIASNGFDLVAASHSHRISGSKQFTAERHTPAFCFYGLGSIVSGFIASEFEREGLVIVGGFHADGSLASVEVCPVWLAESGFAEMSPARCAAILERFTDLTAELSDGTSARRFYGEVSPGVVSLYARDLRAAFRQSGMLGLARKARRIRVHHLRRLLHGVIP